MQRSQRGAVPEHCRWGESERNKSRSRLERVGGGDGMSAYLDLAPATFSARDGRAFAPDDRLEQARVKLKWAASYIRDRE